MPKVLKENFVTPRASMPAASVGRKWACVKRKTVFETMTFSHHLANSHHSEIFPLDGLGQRNKKIS
jgi:hypothetical protein